MNLRKVVAKVFCIWRSVLHMMMFCLKLEFVFQNANISKMTLIHLMRAECYICSDDSIADDHSFLFFWIKAIKMQSGSNKKKWSNSLPPEYLWHSCCVGLLLPVQTEGDQWKWSICLKKFTLCTHLHMLSSKCRRAYVLTQRIKPLHIFHQPLLKKWTSTLLYRDNTLRGNHLLHFASRLFAVRFSLNTRCHCTVHLRLSNRESCGEVKARWWVTS